jgi:hypothetical protein
VSPLLAVAAGLGLLALAPPAPRPASGQGPRPAARDAGEPRVIAAQQATLERNADLRALIEAVHRDADAIVVLSGAVATTPEANRGELPAMLAALGTLAKERRIAVGDGGTKAGLMAAAGRARLASGRAFRLIGVVPARVLAPAGSTVVYPNHSHVIAVDDPALPKGESAWGSETATMYWLFNRLAEGRNSVAVIANGGGSTLEEIAANVEFGRPMILIAGSGGTADAMVSLTRGATPTDGEVLRLQHTARTARLNRRPDLFTIVPISAGAAGLLDALRALLGPVLPRTP